MIRPVSSHAADATAITAPVVSAVANLPHLLTIITALLGLVWYLVQFYDRFVKKAKPDAQPPAPPAD